MNEGLIIIPAYDEEKNLLKVLKDIEGLNIDIDIIVIDDGSKDGTRKIAEDSGINVISHLYNLGYGAALQTGFKYAALEEYSYVIQFDADGQHSTEGILEMIKELRSGSADIIIGSRFLGKGNFKAGLLKRIVIKLMRCLIKAATKENVSDPTSGFKGMSKAIYKYYSKMDNFPNDYPDADVLIKMLKRGYRVYEIPIAVRQRTNGKSMHSGLKPVVYLLKILISIAVILLREKLVKE